MKTQATKLKSKKPSTPAERKQYVKPAWGLKRKILNQILNGQISKHHAHKKYNVSRSLIDYWLKKFTTLEEAERFMEKDKELKKLQKRIEELEWIKEFQQDIIVEFEKTTGKELSKKFLPEYLAKEIARKKHSPKK
jgi:G:T-mismatch repair DNA endonuclease (very short patch repair protein)